MVNLEQQNERLIELVESLTVLVREMSVYQKNQNALTQDRIDKLAHR